MWVDWGKRTGGDHARCAGLLEGVDGGAEVFAGFGFDKGGVLGEGFEGFDGDFDFLGRCDGVDGGGAVGS